MGVKKCILIHVCGGLIEMGPKKWPKQAAFLLFRQRNNTFLEILFIFLLEYSCFAVLRYFLLYCKVDQLCLYIYPPETIHFEVGRKKKLRCGCCSVSRESKQRWGLGSSSVELTQFCMQASWPESPISGDSGVLLHVNKGWVPFSWGPLCSASGRQRGGSECPSCIGCFILKFY